MPWCPKCKTEYKQGIFVCTDCKAALVDSLQETSELEKLAEFHKEETAENFLTFIQQEGISSGSIVYHPETETYELFVAPKDMTEGRKFLDAYEKAILPEEESKENLNEKSKRQSSPYVTAADQYKELHSSAATFLFFGILGLFFTVLHFAGVLHFIQSSFSLIVMTLLFVVFVGIGIASYRKAFSLKGQIGTEKQLTEQIKEWLSQTMTPEYLDRMVKEEALKQGNFLSEQSEEAQVLAKMDGIKRGILQEFQVKENYAEQLAEEFYDTMYQK